MPRKNIAISKYVEQPVKKQRHPASTQAKMSHLAGSTNCRVRGINGISLSANARKRERVKKRSHDLIQGNGQWILM